MIVNKCSRSHTTTDHENDDGCRSQEGSQFCRGFGGIGGILRYQVDVSQFEEIEEDDEAVWSDDDWA